MSGFAIGPFLFSAERVAVILAIVVVLGAAEILSRRVDRRFGPWSFLALAAGFVGARAGHVIDNLPSFAETPWRAFAVWQGGFSLPWAALPLAVVTVLALRRPRLIAWGAGVLAAAFVVWNTSHQLNASSAKPPLPDLILASLDGPPVRLSATAGRPTVINLWATWCPPCRREMPVLAAAAKAHPETRFIFANQGEDEAKIAGYLARQGLVLPNVVLDSSQAVPRHYGTLGIPVTLFVRADGSLAASHMGEISPELLQAKLGALAR